MALCFANQAVVWLRQLLYELEFHDCIRRPTIVYGDNRQANTMCDEDIVTVGNQYTYLPYHFNKEVVEMGFCEIRYVKTAYNLADLFTKPVDASKIRELMMQLVGYQAVDYDKVDQSCLTTKSGQLTGKSK